MTTAGRVLRDAIEVCHRARASAHIARWRKPTDDARPSLGEALGWLRGEGGQEALAEALGSGEVTAEEHTWLVRQISHLVETTAADDAGRRLRADLGEAESPGGAPLHAADEVGALALSDDPAHRDETGRAVASALAQASARLVDAVLDVERSRRRAPLLDFGGLGPARVEPAPDDASDAAKRTEARRTAAREFLARTVDAADDAVAWQVRGLGVGRPVPWHALVRGLRAPGLDAPAHVRTRLHRTAGVWRRLGFESDMSTRMRAERDRGAVLPFASIVCLAAPGDVRIAQAPRDWGVLSDACAAQGVAEALLHALALPTHPPELRRLLPGGVAGAVGALSLQLWAERTQLVRVQGLERSEAERVARVAGAFALLVSRAWAALASVPIEDASGRAQRMELCATAIGDALRCDVPPAIAATVGADPSAARDRAVEHLGGLALAAGLRERHDEDWFLDARLEERFRGAGQRGNLLSVEDFCGEIGVGLDAASARANELVA